MKKILTIAGSDCSGGAGIQADIKTIALHKMYAMSVITALTAQNTIGIRGVQQATPEMVVQQMDCVFEDIRPDAVKIGMVASGDILTAIAERLTAHSAVNIVMDPVMISTSGRRLLEASAVEILRTRLLPLAALITPNIPEAEVLSGLVIGNQADMQRAAERLAQTVPGGILIKGGHLQEDADDLLYVGGQAHWFHAPRIENPNTHGTGCTLSAAIACHLAEGCTLVQSVAYAKEYLTGALRAGLDLGQGSGPLDHTYLL